MKNERDGGKKVTEDFKMDGGREVAEELGLVKREGSSRGGYVGVEGKVGDLGGR